MTSELSLDLIPGSSVFRFLLKTPIFDDIFGQFDREADAVVVDDAECDLYVQAGRCCLIVESGEATHKL